MKELQDKSRISPQFELLAMVGSGLGWTCLKMPASSRRNDCKLGVRARVRMPNMIVHCGR